MDARKNHNFCGTVLSLRKKYGSSELFFGDRTGIYDVV